MTAIGLNYVWANVITRQATKANAGRGVFPDYYPGISIISNRVLGYQTKTVPIQNDSCSCKFDNVVIDLYRAASDMDTVSSWTLNHISLNLGRATSVDPNAILSSRNAEPLYDGPLAPHKNSTLFRIWRFDCRFSLTVDGDSLDFLVYEDVFVTCSHNLQDISWFSVIDLWLQFISGITVDG